MTQAPKGERYCCLHGPMNAASRHNQRLLLPLLIDNFSSVRNSSPPDKSYYNFEGCNFVENLEIQFKYLFTNPSEISFKKCHFNGNIQLQISPKDKVAIEINLVLNECDFTYIGTEIEKIEQSSTINIDDSQMTSNIEILQCKGKLDNLKLTQAHGSFNVSNSCDLNIKKLEFNAFRPSTVINNPHTYSSKISNLAIEEVVFNSAHGRDSTHEIDTSNGIKVVFNGEHSLCDHNVYLNKYCNEKDDTANYYIRASNVISVEINEAKIKDLHIYKNSSENIVFLKISNNSIIKNTFLHNGVLINGCDSRLSSRQGFIANQNVKLSSVKCIAAKNVEIIGPSISVESECIITAHETLLIKKARFAENVCIILTPAITINKTSFYKGLTIKVPSTSTTQLSTLLIDNTNRFLTQIPNIDTIKLPLEYSLPNTNKSYPDIKAIKIYFCPNKLYICINKIVAHYKNYKKLQLTNVNCALSIYQKLTARADSASAGHYHYLSEKLKPWSLEHSIQKTYSLLFGSGYAILRPILFYIVSCIVIYLSVKNGPYTSDLNTHAWKNLLQTFILPFSALKNNLLFSHAHKMSNLWFYFIASILQTVSMFCIGIAVRWRCKRS
jgi:hypothetical protein